MQVDCKTKEENLDRQLEGLTDLVTPWAIRAFSSLNIPHHLSDGIRDLTGLANCTECRPEPLAMLLDYLSGHGIVRTINVDEDHGTSTTSERRYELTELGRRLDPSVGPRWTTRLDPNGSLTRIDQAHAGLTASLKSGTEGYSTIFGEPFWDDLAQNPGLSRRFDEQLEGWSRRWAPAIARHNFWTEYRSVVDVAGGTGTFTSELLRNNASMHCILTELEGSASRAADTLAGWVETGRCAVEIRNFLSDELPEAEAYVLAQVLHDWDDCTAIKILANCVRSNSAGGDIIIVERLVGNATSAQHSGIAEMNLMMLVLFGAKERSVEDYKSLAGAAGLTFVGAVPSDFGLWSMRFRSQPSKQLAPQRAIPNSPFQRDI